MKLKTLFNKACRQLHSVLGGGNRQNVKIIDRGHNNVVQIDKSCQIVDLKITLNGSNNKIEIKDGCFMNGTNIIYVIGDGNNLVIGKNCSFSGDFHIIPENGHNITIGDDCLFAVSSYIRTSDGHPIYNEEGMRINAPKDVVIGNHVWVGQRSAIVKGSHIGNGCVVGMMSMANKSYPANTVIAGIPAKVIREKIRWDVK